MKNTLYYGDNLKILREYIQTESIDLIYLDPPFNSNRNYNVLFKDESGQDSDAQLTAFEDTWHWDMSAESMYHELATTAKPEVATMIGALREFIGANQMMAYLVMMTARLIELHRVLKSTGSLYLHCDPTASHYLKILLDTVFGATNLRNEIIWKRSYGHGDSVRTMGRSHDTIFFYTKSENYTLNRFYHNHDPSYLENFFRHHDEHGVYKLENLTSPNPRPNLTYSYKGYPPPAKGWRVNLERMMQLDEEGKLHFPGKKDGRIMKKVYLHELEGQPMLDVWTDIKPLSAHDKERLRYPTQKPLTLLERIIKASSQEDEVVFDPFCGCGTAVVAAHKLKRKWIGIDITHLAIALQKYRLKDVFNLIEKQDYAVIGEPEDFQAAQQLAQDDRYQFQWWALSLIQAQPLGGDPGSKQGKKGSDKGIDGIITFIDDAKAKPKRLIVQVKSGHVKSGDIRDLIGTLDQERAAIGVFITLEAATSEMKKAAATAGFYHSPNWNKDYPRLQIVTIEELLQGATIQMPPTAQTYKKAQRESLPQGEQQSLL